MERASFGLPDDRYSCLQNQTLSHIKVHGVCNTTYSAADGPIWLARDAAYGHGKQETRIGKGHQSQWTKKHWVHLQNWLVLALSQQTVGTY